MRLFILFKLKYLFLLILTALFFSCFNSQESAIQDGLNRYWPDITMENKPGLYWWWMGSAVDRQNLTFNLEILQQVGIGGVTIVPIYGVQGYEAYYIDYLSPQWMEMLSHAVKEAARLGMWVDMTTGTGWPFGGSHVTPVYAAKKIEHKIYHLSQGQRLSQKLNLPGWQMIIAYHKGSKSINLSDSIDQSGYLNWIAPQGNWDVYVVWQTGTEQKVKRAAPGNHGLVLDPFSVKALDFYLQRFEKAFASFEGPLPRAQYHDSYEYYNANWSENILNEFKKRKGYDLQEYVPMLFDTVAGNDTVGRIKTDYQETLSKLHLAYIRRWCDWAHNLGCITRDQAHGAPSNLLDLYASADIPETETFGSTLFNIPGLRRDPANIGRDAPNPLVLKFSSSAAHVAGKPLIASETCTWLRDHYKAALSQVKPEIDQLFLAGINHIFYHGNAYTPKDAEWPGWLFYASTHFEPENAFWRDFPELNAYVARCQSILQSGQPANDILLYWPIYDIWHNNDLMIKQLTVHNIDWFIQSDFGEIAKNLNQLGYSLDYISDSQLSKLHYLEDMIVAAGGKYRTIIVPECGHMPLETLKNLLSLVEQGASVVMHGGLPEDVPGYADLAQRRHMFRETASALDFVQVSNTGLRLAKLGKGKIISGHNIEEMLTYLDINAETIAKKDIGYIRRTHDAGHYYFLANLGNKTLDDWIQLSLPFESAILLDPLNAKSGSAALRKKNNKSQIYLQLSPGQSCFIKTFSKEANIILPPWKYIQMDKTGFELTGNWQVDFVQGGPALPASFTTHNLDSWTNREDAEAKRFAGTARYTITFDLPDNKAGDWILDLGRVCESARIKVNGRDAGILWSIPFSLSIGEFLHTGSNMLEVEVTNLSANRIADLDRRKVNWKKFHDINFVNIQYKPFDASKWPLMDSGLLGPVVLIPAKCIEFN